MIERNYVFISDGGERRDNDWTLIAPADVVDRGMTRFRDDIRNGWHCVAGLTRYVAVRGTMAGQPCAPFWRHRLGAEGAARRMHAEGKDEFLWLGGDEVATDPDEWCVLDLEEGLVYASMVRGPSAAARPNPTDAEIVEAWHAAIRGLEDAGRWDEIAMMLDEGLAASATWAEYQAARSRELKRLAEEARERDRNRVVCEGTLGEDY